MPDTIKQYSDPEKPVHVVFVGAGAVGCFYASRLHHPSKNIHVSLIARSNYKALLDNGVKLQTYSFGDYTFTPHAVFPNVAAAASAPVQQWDYVVITTKALPDRGDDSALIAPLIGPNSCIVLIQNGVGVEAPYRTRFPSTPIISAVTVVSAEQISQGVIRQNRWTRIHLGPYSNSASFDSSTPITKDRDEVSPSATTTPKVESTGNLTPTGSSSPSPSPSSSAPSSHHKLTDSDLALQQRGYDLASRLTSYLVHLGSVRDAHLSTESHLQLIRWHKLCINAAFNPCSILSGGIGNADMVRDPELRLFLSAIMYEIWDAAPLILGLPKGEGFEKDPKGFATPEKILKSTERNVGSKPSMLLDWEAGRPLELEVIVGNPVRIARGRGVEMPRLQGVYALLRSMQSVRERRKREGKL
ncbi:2-dehydropantoate 2-reductase [Neurospora crassa]|uniref:2-dehydropantoate 2-reductase n=1 Tax=Neurospora crassa (strain ATCC 24698 / 74-OR23-1A / CBS 708.71 / DSM 1257 / FGSC 987) TaxID=367110 RepID=Q7S6K3_NEUCR|nr:2-dehydropantoate 2-reductase [Neurospora crassa OR74A]EAA31155.1 2-dehydropantoate 2-reductase [Neurospora crassa OR74A]KHE89033.1 2-dehydropantoate 2-reductase [Neurospora crassa]|eukprot:XP_960391.1 2-dehydropantoate 2-reductase [Neurospora crassa OR74A]